MFLFYDSRKNNLNKTNESVKTDSLPEDDICRGGKIFAAVTFAGQINLGSDLKLFVTIVAIFLEIPGCWFEHVVNSVAAHWHNHFCARLVEPSLGTQIGSSIVGG